MTNEFEKLISSHHQNDFSADMTRFAEFMCSYHIGQRHFRYLGRFYRAAFRKLNDSLKVLPVPGDVRPYDSDVATCILWPRGDMDQTPAGL